LTPYLRSGAAFAVLTALLAGCGSTSSLRTYVLGNPGPSATGVWSEAGLPIIELGTVSVPDYLDSTDILRNTTANEVTASPTGRWGERLSLGITHALASGLATRLPRTVITTTTGAGPTRRLLVEIDRFEIAGDGRCLLSARWQITASDGETEAAGEHGTFSQSAGSIDDQAVASAMTGAVDQLADQIALTVQRALTPHAK